MDSPENENIQSDTVNECISDEKTVTTEVHLDLNNERKSNEDIETVFHNNFTTLNMKLPVAVQNCVPAALQELVVITNTESGFLNEPKLPISTFHTSDGSESFSKRLCIEQDGQTFILALQDNLEGFSNVVEIPQKNFPGLDATQLISYQDSNNLTIKEGINQNWFTSREDKSTLHDKGHIWKQGMWSKEEVELLENNIQSYCKEHEISNPATIVFEMSKDERKDFYRTIAKGLNRPLFSVYRRVIRMYDNKNHVGKYTLEELEQLKKLRSIHGNDWQAIGSAMGRSASSIKDRCRLMKDNCNQGKWLPIEEQRLAEAVYDLTKALPGEMISSGLSWANVAERVGTRSEKQCRTKWLNYLNWKVAGGTEWTRDDDITLIYRVFSLNATDENQVDWTELSKDWLSVRSPQWLRGKWWSLKRHVPNSNVVSFQEACEYLYQQFVMKIKVKEEDISNSTTETAISNSLQSNLTNLATSQAIYTRPKPAILQPAALSSPSSQIVVTASAQICPSPVVTLTNASCVAPTLTPVTPVLQTLEVLPQNVQISPNPQTFLLTTQQTLPLTTTISPSQIIIQAMTSEELQRNDNVQVNDPHIVINAQTSLASTQIPSAPPSPSGTLEENPHVIIKAYGSQDLNESDNINQDCDIEAVHHVTIGDDKSTHLILSDPMLAASGSPETANLDMESEKIHLSENGLTHN